jgi:CRISPR-associated protein Csh2
MSDTIKEKSELLFLYDSIYSVPNGDPFTGEQRYDEETKKVLVSDVRIKRFIRDHFLDHEDEREVYVWNDLSEASSGSGSEARIDSLKKKHEDNEEVDTEDAKELMKTCIDVKLFGGVSTKTGMTANLTGPVQFALLNPSLNKVDLRMHQNTSVFVSNVEKKQGAIATSTVVPYSLLKIHGWINPQSANHTGLTQEEVELMFEALWDSINNANTRSKSNQSSLLLLQIVYDDPRKKLYRIGERIKIEPKDGKREEEMRGLGDVSFDFSGLREAVQSDLVKEVRYYTELDMIEKALLGEGDESDKFEKMSLHQSTSQKS